MGCMEDYCYKCSKKLPEDDTSWLCETCKQIDKETEKRIAAVGKVGSSSGASFSDCERYRYVLWRIWSTAEPLVNFIMLNPSTADQRVNDPTIERCVRRAGMWGYGGLVVTNLFAYRTVSPNILKRQADPVGPDNDQHILAEAKSAALVICAWGSHGQHLKRADYVVARLRESGIKLQVLGENRPAHPLYLSYDIWPKPWDSGPA